MSKKKLVVGAKVTVYRIPKNCAFWLSPRMDFLLNKSTEIIGTYDIDYGHIHLASNFIVPISCLKAL